MGCGCCKKKKTNKLYLIQEEKNKDEELSSTPGQPYNNSLIKNKDQRIEQRKEGSNTIKISIGGNDEENDHGINELYTNEETENSEIIKENEQGGKLRNTTRANNKKNCLFDNNDAENEQSKKLRNTTGAYNKINSLLDNNDNENEQSEEELNTNKESKDIKINIENNDEENEQEEELNSKKGTEKSEIKIENEQGGKLRNTTGANNKKIDYLIIMM